jgi:hypothetical protein
MVKSALLQVVQTESGKVQLLDLPGWVRMSLLTETSVYLASSSEVEGITGKYFFNSHPIPTAPQANDMVIAEKLWNVSAEMVMEHHPPGHHLPG